MRKLVGILAITLAGAMASANTINMVAIEAFNKAVMTDVGTLGLNLKQGDMAQYALKMSIISGTMTMTVKEVTADQAIITQDMDLGFMGKQSCEITMVPTTGETKKMVCNGQEQKPSDPSDIEVIETKEDTVKVPAGTFVCFYVKAKVKSQNAVVEQWVNLKDVPVVGLVKTIAPSQLGNVTIELSKFKKN